MQNNLPFGMKKKENSMGFSFFFAFFEKFFIATCKVAPRYPTKWVS